MTLSSPLVEIRNVTYRYPQSDVAVLDDACFAFGSKKKGLIGPNGSGKTTLLHIIMGLLRPDAGEILFQGQPLKREKDFFALRAQVGFLFQNADDQLFCPTVLEDVAFGPLNLGKSTDEAISIAETTLARLGLHNFGERLTHKLSGGEKKLVSLATVLAMEPSVLVLDEPTNTLSPQTRDRLAELLTDLDLPCLIVSHDWDFLATTAEEFWTIEAGKVQLCQGAHPHTHTHIHTYGDHVHSHQAKV